MVMIDTLKQRAITSNPIHVEDKKLRKELKEKREKEEGQFIIRRGKVIEVQQGARRRESQPAQDF